MQTVLVLAVVLVTGAVWLRFAVRPALIAYRLGRMVGRLQGERQAAAGRGVAVPPEGAGPVGSGS